jgi:hypothetical protein
MVNIYLWLEEHNLVIHRWENGSETKTFQLRNWPMILMPVIVPCGWLFMAIVSHMKRLGKYVNTQATDPKLG